MSQTTHEHAGESYHHHWFPSFIPSSERGKLAMQRMASVRDEIEPKTHDLRCLRNEQRTPSVVLPVVLAWVSKQIRTSQALAAAYLHDNPGALDHTSSTVVRDEINRICEEWGDMAVEFFEGELPSQYKEHSEVPEALKAIDRTARDECSVWLHAVQSALELRGKQATADQSDTTARASSNRSPVGAGMPRDEANRRAWGFLSTDETFFTKSAKEWAKAIGCSERTVSKLPAWKEAMGRRKNKTSRKITTPRKAFGGMEILERQGEPDDSAEVQDTIERIKTDPRMTAEGLKAIENMTPEERRDLAEAYESQQADWELDPKEPDLQSDPSDSPEERTKKDRLRHPRAPHQV